VTKPSARSVGRAALIPVWCVVLVLLVIATAHVVLFDRYHVFMLVNSYTLWVFLPAYAIAVAAALFRARLLTIAAAALIALHLAWVLPPLFRTVRIPAAAAGPSHLRIVSANLNFDNGDHGPLLAELARDRADLVFLQEVTPAWWRAIEHSELGANYRNRVQEPRTDPGGQAILSRRPLTGVEIRHADGWPIITANVRVDDTVVHVANVHLVAPLDTFSRNQQQQHAITRIVRTLPRPRLIVGDFNASPYNRWFAQLRGLGLREAHEAVGRSWATTWPNGQRHLPPLRLDHVFVDPQVVPVAAREGTGTGSDHRPIIVDLAVLPLRATLRDHARQPSSRADPRTRSTVRISPQSLDRQGTRHHRRGAAPRTI
jgi:endonuclease/exonuclease/phosphatase (EEP) superfamily protein YafD